MNPNSKQRPVSFIAPGQLAKDRVCGKKISNVGHGSRRIQVVAQKTTHMCYHGRTSGYPAHKLFVHYGEDKWEERNVTEESSFLDVLSICNRFIDIYSFGIKVTDADGKTLTNDKEFLSFLKEHEDDENLSLYLYKDPTVQPVHFKLPQDNPSLVSVSRDSPVRDVMEDDVSVPRASPMTSRDVMEHDGYSDETSYDTTIKNAKVSATKMMRKGRGVNKNPKIAALKKGEKLAIEFYNNRGVGPNHSYWSRHLGKIVRNKHMCPVRVYSWKEMTEDNKEHMWAAVKESFSNPHMELYREHTLDHMDTLWTAWRSSLNKKYVKTCKTKALVLKNVPPGMNNKDWEWLATNKFLTDKFQKVSTRNSDNRVKGVMPHRSGSQPHRHIIYEMGGKVDTPPDIAKIFEATRQKKGKFLVPSEQEKYDEIVKTIQANESLSPIEVVETCFGPQNHSYVFGFGGGIKRKHFGDPEATQVKVLKAKLQDKEEENNDLRRRVDKIESLLARMASENLPTLDELPRCDDEQ